MNMFEILPRGLLRLWLLLLAFPHCSPSYVRFAGARNHGKLATPASKLFNRFLFSWVVPFYLTSKGLSKLLATILMMNNPRFAWLQLWQSLRWPKLPIPTALRASRRFSILSGLELSDNAVKVLRL